LRAMVDLACYGTGGPVPRYEIAARQEVSEQYLAQLFLKLKHAGLVDSVRGPGGGYLLALQPEEITAGDVLRAVEEVLAPVYCVGDGEDAVCDRVDGCPTHWLWQRLGETIRETLDSVTVAELCTHARWDLSTPIGQEEGVMDV
jgi:Rrf2 family cysteine metabolism transcriptional repressor